MKHSILLLALSIRIFALSTDPTPPASPVKLVMVHASIGRAWLHDANNYGGLGTVLGENNYYVNDLDKDWDAPENENIFNNGTTGGGTYPGAIYNWFFNTTIQGNSVTKSENILTSIYTAENAFSAGGGWATYERNVPDPGGENTIILFKPTHVSSGVKSNNNTVWEELIGKHPSSNVSTIENNQQLYIEMVNFFKDHPEKMFVLITPPPYAANTTENAESSNPDFAANARTLNTWLVTEWLQNLDYENRNVYVFDFFNVITDPGNHHRVVGEAGNYTVEYITDPGSSNFGYAGYYNDPTNSHPAGGGSEGSAGEKGTLELVPLLNVYYNRYQEWVDSVGVVIEKSIGQTVAHNIQIKGALFRSLNEDLSFSLMDLQGRLILKKSLRSGESHNLATKNISRGLYLININSETSRSVIRYLHE